MTHPDSVVGLCAKRQWVLDLGIDVFMLDDDCLGMHRIYETKGGRRKALASPERVKDIINSTADTARKMGAYLYGFASHCNPVTFDSHRPFKFGGYTPGGAMGILKGSKLRFPVESTLTIDDYWICLLNSFHHRFAWYDKRFAFGFMTTYVGEGGMSEFRKADTEYQATLYLQKMFGKDVVVKKGKPTGIATKKEKNRDARSIRLPFKT